MAKPKDHVTVYFSTAKNKYVAVSAFGPSAYGDDPQEAINNLRAVKAENGDCQNVWR